MITADLFESLPPRTDTEPLGERAAVLHGFALALAEETLRDVERIAAAAPFRHLITPGGFPMSVAMTNCGALGWVSDLGGYRYDAVDPLRGAPWPAMPHSFVELARRAAAEVGFSNYLPDACLINRYEARARLSLHQDKDENDRVAPVVSVSLGLPATFLWGGLQRADRTRRLRLENGDVVVWGGPSRFNYHGVAPLADGHHPLTGRCRINLTFRKVR